MKCTVLLIAFIFSYAHALERPSLQAIIDSTPKDATVVLKAGTYQGPVIVNKAITIDGRNEVIFDGGGKGSVITILADGVVVKNLKVINSGDSHDKMDAGILVRSSNNKFHNNIISNTLFGFNLAKSHNNELIGNDISSKKVDLGMRGDGIKVWASNNNLFSKNIIHDSRDMVIWYSDGNKVLDNKGWNNRYSLHFMYSGANTVLRNKYRNSAVGIFLMYSHDTVIENNQISFSTGGTGMGIGMKEVDNLTIRFNSIVYNTTGIYLDQSPHKPSAHNIIFGNTIAHNKDGVVLHGTLINNVFKGNAFLDNIEDVYVHSNGTASENIWSGNYWADYEGFDRNSDGYGD